MLRPVTSLLGATRSNTTPQIPRTCTIPSHRDRIFSPGDDRRASAMNPMFLDIVFNVSLTCSLLEKTPELSPLVLLRRLFITISLTFAQRWKASLSENPKNTVWLQEARHRPNRRGLCSPDRGKKTRRRGLNSGFEHEVS